MEKQDAKYVLFIYMKYVGIKMLIDATEEATLKINMAEPA